MSLGRDRCPTCGSLWLWETSGALATIGGLVRAVHPPGPCVPIAQPAIFSTRTSYCSYEPCGREYEKHANAQRFCSGTCRAAQLAADRFIPKRKYRCAVCLEPFASARRNRKTCGGSCRTEWQRRYKERLALNREVRAYVRRRAA